MNCIRMWDAFSFHDVAEWMEQMQDLDEQLYSCMEWQANAFAGQLLVDPEYLAPIFHKHIKKTKTKLKQPSDYDPQTLFDVCFELICETVADVFYVHPVSIAVRADKMGLSDELGEELFGGEVDIVTRGRNEDW